MRRKLCADDVETEPGRPATARSGWNEHVYGIRTELRFEKVEFAQLLQARRAIAQGADILVEAFKHVGGGIGAPVVQGGLVADI